MSQKLLQDILWNEFKVANVIGFKSGKFDLNLILSKLIKSKWGIASAIGSSSQFKAISVFPKDDSKLTKTKFGLRYIDIRNYIGGSTLDQFTEDFGNKDGKS